eukprot:GHVN01065865.1.p1 GENE.GHVN01065865.1~~GHVN01065865.1.p1  ORF type:complete len:1126 (-),score=204.26 GHVN01065865.1:1383-4760(-)
MFEAWRGFTKEIADLMQVGLPPEENTASPSRARLTEQAPESSTRLSPNANSTSSNPSSVTKPSSEAVTSDRTHQVEPTVHYSPSSLGELTHQIPLKSDPAEASLRANLLIAPVVALSSSQPQPQSSVPQPQRPLRLDNLQPSAHVIQPRSLPPPHTLLPDVGGRTVGDTGSPDGPVNYLRTHNSHTSLGSLTSSIRPMVIGNQGSMETGTDTPPFDGSEQGTAPPSPPDESDGALRRVRSSHRELLDNSSTGHSTSQRSSLPPSATERHLPSGDRFRETDEKGTTTGVGVSPNSQSERHLSLNDRISYSPPKVSFSDLHAREVGERHTRDDSFVLPDSLTADRGSVRSMAFIGSPMVGVSHGKSNSPTNKVPLQSKLHHFRSYCLSKATRTAKGPLYSDKKEVDSPSSGSGWFDDAASPTGSSDTSSPNNRVWKERAFYCADDWALAGVVTLTSHSFTFEPDPREKSVREKGIGQYQVYIDLKDVDECAVINVPMKDMGEANCFNHLSHPSLSPKEAGELKLSFLEILVSSRHRRSISPVTGSRSPRASRGSSPREFRASPNSPDVAMATDTSPAAFFLPSLTEPAALPQGDQLSPRSANLVTPQLCVSSTRPHNGLAPPKIRRSSTSPLGGPHLHRSSRSHGSISSPVRGTTCAVFRLSNQSVTRPIANAILQQIQMKLERSPSQDEQSQRSLRTLTYVPHNSSSLVEQWVAPETPQLPQRSRTLANHEQRGDDEEHDISGSRSSMTSDVAGAIGYLTSRWMSKSHHNQSQSSLSDRDSQSRGAVINGGDAAGVTDRSPTLSTTPRGVALPRSLQGRKLADPLFTPPMRPADLLHPNDFEGKKKRSTPPKERLRRSCDVGEVLQHKDDYLSVLKCKEVQKARSEACDVQDLDDSDEYDDPFAVELEIPEGAADFMNREIVSQILQHLPATVSIRPWRLVFCSLLHGVSFQSFYRLVEDRAPCVLVVRDSAGVVFGGFSFEAFHSSSKFYGSGGNFVFTFLEDETPKSTDKRSNGSLDVDGDDDTGDAVDAFEQKVASLCSSSEVGRMSYPAAIRVFHWSRRNQFMTFSDRQSIALGGGGSFALTIDKDFLRGSSSPCTTFNSPCLASKPDFIVKNFQVWVLSDE